MCTRVPSWSNQHEDIASFCSGLEREIQDFYGDASLHVWQKLKTTFCDPVHLQNMEQNITRTSNLLLGTEAAQDLVRAFVADVQHNLAMSVRAYYVESRNMRQLGHIVVVYIFATTELILHSPQVSNAVSKYCHKLVKQMCFAIRQRPLNENLASVVVETATASNGLLSLMTAIERILNAYSIAPVAVIVTYIKELIGDILKRGYLSPLTCARVHLEEMALTLANSHNCMKRILMQEQEEQQVQEQEPQQEQESKWWDKLMNDLVKAKHPEDHMDHHNPYEWAA